MQYCLAFTMLGTGEHAMGLTTPDITTCDQISQAFPLCYCILRAMKTGVGNDKVTLAHMVSTEAIEDRF